VLPLILECRRKEVMWAAGTSVGFLNSEPLASSLTSSSSLKSSSSSSLPSTSFPRWTSATNWLPFHVRRTPQKRKRKKNGEKQFFRAPKSVTKK
jgi:hypothetical protein